MKILVLSNLVSYTFNFRLEIIDALLAKGWEVVIACDNDSQEKYDMLSGKVRLIQVRFNGKGKNIFEELKLIRTYKKLIRKEKPDAVLTFTIKMNLYGGLAASSRHIPFIPMITGLGELEKQGRLQKLLLFLHKRVMPKARCVFFQNQANIDFFRTHGIPCVKTVLLPGSGINLDKYAVLPYPPETEQFAFAFIGRLTEAKGIDEYLAAAQNLSSLARFYVAGVCDEKYRETVKMLDRKGIVTNLGYVEDVRTVLSLAGCVVLPTYHPEGMSNVLLEAGACGRPAICTDRPGCNEIVINGVTGFYCKPKDVQNLQDVMESFLVLDFEKKREMGLVARAHVEKNFDRNTVVRAYIGELEALS